MNTDGDDPFSSKNRGSWWSRMSRHEQIVAAILGAIVTGFFGILIALIGTSSARSHIDSSGATESSPAPVASSPAPAPSSPIATGTETTSAPSSSPPSPAGAVEDPSPSAPSVASKGQYLAYLSPVSNSGFFDTGAAAINGSNYLNSVILDMGLSGPYSVDYNAERQWRFLEATVGLRDDSNQKQQVEFQIFADGSPIYSHIFALGQSQYVKLNIVGVLRLELRAMTVGDFYGGAYPVWGNAYLAR